MRPGLSRLNTSLVMIRWYRGVSRKAVDRLRLALSPPAHRAGCPIQVWRSVANVSER